MSCSVGHHHTCLGSMKSMGMIFEGMMQVDRRKDGDVISMVALSRSYHRTAMDLKNQSEAIARTGAKVPVHELCQS